MFSDRPKPHEVVLLSIIGLLIDVFLVILVVIIFIIILESFWSSPPGAGA
jgi:hypothetical protein